MGQIVVKGGEKHLESYFHLATFRINLNESQHPFKILGITGDGHIILGIWHSKASAGDYILGIFGRKWGTVIAAAVGDFYNLCRFKCREVNPGNTRGIVAIDKNPATICLSVRL